MLDLTDHFDQFNDDPDAPFGELPRVESDSVGRIRVRHQFHDDYGVEILVRPLDTTDGW